jgi:hypothetical protein
LDIRKTQNRRSREQERNRARETNGRTSPGSGSSWRSPQDNRTEHELEQIKFTDKKRFVLSVDELEKVYQDALKAGRDPQMIVDFERHHKRAIIIIEERR